MEVRAYCELLIKLLIFMRRSICRCHKLSILIAVVNHFLSWVALRISRYVLNDVLSTVGFNGRLQFESAKLALVVNYKVSCLTQRLQVAACLSVQSRTLCFKILRLHLITAIHVIMSCVSNRVQMSVDLISTLMMLVCAWMRYRLALALLHTIFNSHVVVLIGIDIMHSSRARNNALETCWSHCRNRYIAFIRCWCFVTFGFGQLTVLGVVE